VSPQERRTAIERYNQRLAEFGPTERALGWGEKGRSRIRFEVLASQWDLRDARVLDVGCGFGDLFGYLRERGVTGVRYIGVDINASLLAIARERYPEARFAEADCRRLRPSTRSDYAFCSGMFNHKLEDNAGFIAAMFEQFDAAAEKGFAANFLSDRVEYRLEHTYHADPRVILELAYRYSNNVVLRNDYMPYEFTVFVNKGSRVDPSLSVYEEFVRIEKGPPQ
jgi:SAM-dependent methyltransferase